MFRNASPLRILCIFILVVVALVVAGVLTSCSSRTDDAGQTSANVPVNYSGTWKADQGIEAVIDGDNVEINIGDTESSALYWKGTFPVEIGSKTVTSQADVEALSSSMLGSQDKTKVFNVSNDEITFKMSMMGVTQTVHLKRS